MPIRDVNYCYAYKYSIYQLTKLRDIEKVDTELENNASLNILLSKFITRVVKQTNYTFLCLNEPYHGIINLRLIKTQIHIRALQFCC